MKENKSMRALAKRLAKKTEDRLYEIAVRELVEDDFLNQKDYVCCRDRAKHAMQLAIEPAIEDLGYAIAVSREVEYKEDTLEEQASLLSAGADPEIGTLGFWNHD